MLSIVVADFREDFQHYLNDLEYSAIKDLQALIDFNIKHGDMELPPGELLFTA